MRTSGSLPRKGRISRKGPGVGEDRVGAGSHGDSGNGTDDGAGAEREVSRDGKCSPSHDAMLKDAAGLESDVAGDAATAAEGRCPLDGDGGATGAAIDPER